MTYEKLYRVFNEQFAITGLSLDEVGRLLNLIGALYVASKKKNDSLNLYDFIYDKIVKIDSINPKGGAFIRTKPEKGALDSLILPICLHIDLYLTQGFKPSTMGLKDSKEVLQIINDLINKRVPF